MKNVKLDNGFECKVNDKRMRDAHFLETLLSTSDDDYSAIFKLIHLMLGDEQKEKLYAYLAKDDGEGGTYTDIDDVSSAVQEIFEKLQIDGENTGKNS